MRLRILDRGPVALRPFFGASRVLGLKMPDIGKLFVYRSLFFGRPWGVAMQSVMRGPSQWAPGGSELFAVFTSQLNQCPFLIDTHGAVASSYLGWELVPPGRKEWASAAIHGPL